MAERNENIEEEYTVEDVDAMINALVDLLVKKGIITEEEYTKELNSYYE